MKNFSLWEIYDNNKRKSENTMILHMQQIAHINLLAWAPARACAIAHVSWNSVEKAKSWFQIIVIQDFFTEMKYSAI